MKCLQAGCDMSELKITGDKLWKRVLNILEPRCYDLNPPPSLKLVYTCKDCDNFCLRYNYFTLNRRILVLFL